MSNPENTTIKNVLPVGAGVATGFCLGVVLIYLCAIMINSDESLAGMLLFLAIGIFIPAFSGGLVCGYISDRKDNVLSLITSLILVFILSINNDFRFGIPVYQVLLLFFLIILFTYSGGLIGRKLKKLYG